jgi:hypothetical protein
VTDVGKRARELITFCDGIADAGFEGLVRRSRAVARDALVLAAELETERTARQKIQADRDRLLTMLADKAGRALKEKRLAA